MIHARKTVIRLRIVQDQIKTIMEIVAGARKTGAGAQIALAVVNGEEETGDAERHLSFALYDVRQAAKGGALHDPLNHRQKR